MKRICPTGFHQSGSGHLVYGRFEPRYFETLHSMVSLAAGRCQFERRTDGPTDHHEPPKQIHR